MLDPDLIVLCEHEREPDECPICGGDEPEHPVFDPHVWLKRHRAETADVDVPEELAGVPLS